MRKPTPIASVGVKDRIQQIQINDAEVTAIVERWFLNLAESNSTAFGEDDEGFVDVADFDRSDGGQEGFDQGDFIVGKSNHELCLK